jgi:hypothetical protein
MAEQQAIHFQCQRRRTGWSCTVVVGDDPGATIHRVTVSADDLRRLAPADGSVEHLVEASFAFLLEREPRESILGAFELPLIGRYFPEYEREIQRRLGR